MPPRREPDRITVQTSRGEFDKWTSLKVTNDITSPTEAAFVIGGPEVWSELEDIFSPGGDFIVKLNGQPRLTGRAEVDELQLSPGGGTVLQVTIRPRSADARYASANPEVRVEDASIQDFILQCYEPLGFTLESFVFAPFVARNLITGEAAGAGPPEDFEEIKVDQAKVSGGETIHQAVERHLKRFGATQWDAPDGRVIIGRPDDEQAPTYKLTSKRGAAAAANNMGSPRKIRDWSEVPLEINVYGATPGKTNAKAALKGVVINDDVQAVFDATGHFNRRVLIPTQQGKTQAQVDRAAQREMSARIRRIDAWQIPVDGWTYWNGERQVPWANNTTVDIDVDSTGGPQGRYLIVRVELNLSPQGGTTAALQVVAPGVWVI